MTSSSPKPFARGRNHDLIVKTLSQYSRETYEYRASILEFDAGHSREEAEAMALAEAVAAKGEKG